MSKLSAIAIDISQRLIREVGGGICSTAWGNTEQQEAAAASSLLGKARPCSCYSSQRCLRWCRNAQRFPRRHRRISASNKIAVQSQARVPFSHLPPRNRGSG